MLVFAADALVRFRSGRILIHTTASAMPAFESDQPMLVGWLCQFFRPCDTEAAVAGLDAPARPGVQQVLDYLQKAGTLVAAESDESRAPSAEVADERSTLHLKLLARSVYDLAADLRAYGPHAERELSGRSGIGLERRLMSLLAATDGLRGALRALREDYLREQLAALRVEPGAANLRLHIGCGGQLLEGWINVDVHPAPLALNVLWGLPFGSGSVDYIFVSHLLEHLFYPRDVKPFLAELRRVLAPGGVVRIVVPDIEQCIEAYQQRDPLFFASRREFWSWWPENPTRLEDFLAYAGAGPEPAYLFEAHKYGYDYETLARVLTEAGFAAVEKSAFMQSRHEPLRVDAASTVARARYGDRYYSLFVEAAAP